MNPVPGGDDDDFGKLMGMEAKRLLRVPALHRDGKAIRLEPVLAFEYLVRHGGRRNHGGGEETRLAR